MTTETTTTDTALSPAAEAVIALIHQRDHVTFVEIRNVLQPLMPLDGDISLELPTLPNVLLWFNMSPQWCDVMREVQASKQVYPVSASVLTYAIDGTVWQVPLAKRPPKGGYKTPHWAPVCFRPARPDTMKGRKTQ